MTETNPGTIEVEVVYARVDRYWNTFARVPFGACVGVALAAAGDAWLPERYRDVVAAPAGMAVFGRVATARTRLHDGDRIELLRALVADPKQARKQRAAEAKRGKRPG